MFAALGHHQVGDICRWDGERWEALTGPETEEEGSEAFSAVYDLLIALEDLAGIAPSDLALPDPAEAWDQAKERTYDAYNRLEGLMESWGDERERPVAARERGHQLQLVDKQWAFAATTRTQWALIAQPGGKPITLCTP